MDVINLPQGERAAEDVDCIHVERTPTGRFQLTGSALVNCDDGSDSAESIALIGDPSYASAEEAEAAGLAWAQQQCVATLYVSRA